MHRLLIVRSSPAAPAKFLVIADSDRASVSASEPATIQDAGGTDWEEFDDSAGYSSPYATIPCRGRVSSLGYWYVKRTGRTLDFDFAAARISEQKVVLHGLLNARFRGREYQAEAGDCMVFLLDEQEVAAGVPFLVQFDGDEECSVMYTEYALD